MSAPVLHTSSGFTGSSPGPRSAPRRAPVSRRAASKRAPVCSATSATSTRSAPESCTVATLPAADAAGPDRAADRERSRVSTNSSSLSTADAPRRRRTTPPRPHPSPASAPECAVTSARPVGEPPTHEHDDGNRHTLPREPDRPGTGVRRAGSRGTTRRRVSPAGPARTTGSPPARVTISCPAETTRLYSRRRWVRRRQRRPSRSG